MVIKRIMHSFSLLVYLFRKYCSLDWTNWTNPEQFISKGKQIIQFLSYNIYITNHPYSLGPLSSEIMKSLRFFELNFFYVSQTFTRINVMLSLVCSSRREYAY